MKAILTIFLLVPTLGLAVENESLAELVRQCAPNVHPLTMGSIVAAESGGNPYALLDNGSAYLPRSARTVRSFRPQSKPEAVMLAKNLIDAGHIVDMGLGQINSRNLSKLGMTVENAFDPCHNVWAGQTILSNFYSQAIAKYGDDKKALLHALSGYNTGSMTAGLTNGYVERVLSMSKIPLPSLKVAPAYNQGYSRVIAGQATGHGVISGRITAHQAKLASADVLNW